MKKNPYPDWFKITAGMVYGISMGFYIWSFFADSKIPLLLGTLFFWPVFFGQIYFAYLKK